MDIYQLKTFVAVAREGSITRAAEVVHLSQPAVSAHIKSIEDTLGLTLFERTARGMSLTMDGQRLLARAEQTLAAHRDLMDEASRLKSHLRGRLRLGVASNANHRAVGRLVTGLAERCPEVEVVLKHATSNEIMSAIRGGALDAGFYNEVGEPDADVTAVEIAQFRIQVMAPPGRLTITDPPNWRTLSDTPWIYPASSACCGRAAESLFKSQHFRPKRVISVDRETMTRTLIASGIGVGLLHEDTARDALARGEMACVYTCQTVVRSLFGYSTSRTQDPIISAAAALVG